MYTTYHFNSVTEITVDVVDSIKTAFKGKSIVLTVEEENENDDLPQWHLPILQERLQNMDTTEFADTTEFLNSFKQS
jgi:hypothetical protein